MQQQPTPIRRQEDRRPEDVVLTRVFNTAVLTSLKTAVTDVDRAELELIIRSPAFRAILRSVHNLSSQLQISEGDASERIIETFRKLDLLWQGYVRDEGFKKILG